MLAMPVYGKFRMQFSFIGRADLIVVVRFQWFFSFSLFVSFETTDSKQRDCRRPRIKAHPYSPSNNGQISLRSGERFLRVFSPRYPTLCARRDVATCLKITLTYPTASLRRSVIPTGFNPHPRSMANRKDTWNSIFGPYREAETE